MGLAVAGTLTAFSFYYRPSASGILESARVHRSQAARCREEQLIYLTDGEQRG